MNKQDFIDKGWGVGTKLRVDECPEDKLFQILFMGDKAFFGISDEGVECSWDYDEWNGYDSGWQEYKEPEVKMKTLVANSYGKWQEYKNNRFSEYTIRELQDELNQRNYEALNKLRSDGIWEERKEPKYGTAPVEGIRWMTPLPQWIPCAERMPTIDDKGTIAVLVNGHVFIGSVSVNTNTCFNYLIENERFVFLIETSPSCEFLPRGQWENDPRFAEPTHWMPLPKPPEEECKA